MENLIKKWPLEPQKEIWMGYIYQLEVYIKMVKVDFKDSIQNECYEKKVWKSKA